MDQTPDREQQERREIKLPPPSEAEPLFRAALERLQYFVGLLHGSEEILKDKKRFVQSHYDPDAWEEVERDQLSQDEWRELCKDLGIDPDTDKSVLPERFPKPVIEAGPQGVEKSPSLPLTALIAAYVLSSPSATPLLRRLHHDPDSVLPAQQGEVSWWEEQGANEPTSEEWQKICAKVEELWKIAGHLAILMRGGTLERGTSIRELSSFEHYVAWRIHELQSELQSELQKQDGASEEKISEEELNERLHERLSAESRLYRELGFSVENVRDLKYTGLRPPEYWQQ